MTEPIQPTPGAPAGNTSPQTPPTPGAPAPSAPAPTTPPATPAQPFDPSSLSPEAQAWLKDQVAAADLKARTGSKANAAAEARALLAADVAKALGLTGDPPDPATLAAQVEDARNAAWATSVELHIFRTAAAAGADPDKLLDSRKFIESLDDLVDLDPSSEEFRTQLQAKVQAAAAQYPAAPQTPGAPSGPRPDPSQGSRGTPPAARPTSLTAAYAAHYAAKAGKR